MRCWVLPIDDNTGSAFEEPSTRLITLDLGRIEMKNQLKSNIDKCKSGASFLERCRIKDREPDG